MPAGPFRMHVEGFQQTHDAALHAALSWRPKVGPEQALVSADFGMGLRTDGGVASLDVLLPSPPVPAGCGDALVLRVQFVSGSSPFMEFLVTLQTP